MEYLILLRSVNSHILSRAVVRDFVVKGCQFRYLDEVAETLFLHQIVCDIKLEVGCLLGEDSRPRIETPNLLPFKFFWAKVLEQEIQLRK